MTSRRLLLVVLVAALAVLTGAAPASAHARWLGSDPEEGSVLDALPPVVVMTYSEDIAPEFVDTAVVPPGGEPVTTQAVADGAEVTIDVAAAVPDPAPGTWQVVARVVSADGHPVEHTTTFDVRAASGPAATAGDPAPADPGASTEPEDEPGTEPEPAVEATAAAPEQGSGDVSADPLAATADDLPGWAGVLLVVAAVLAAAGAVVVALRRRVPPTE